MNRSSLGKIAVVGSGAVGCCYGGMLAHAGHDVHFLMRADLDTVRREGLRIFTKGNEVYLPRVQCAAIANAQMCSAMRRCARRRVRSWMSCPMPRAGSGTRSSGMWRSGAERL